MWNTSNGLRRWFANGLPNLNSSSKYAPTSVLSSAVVGLPDPDWGQRVHAIVQLAEPLSEEALREHLDGQLVRNKHPRTFEFVDTPLRDEAGKVRRSALREARIASG